MFFFLCVAMVLAGVLGPASAFEYERDGLIIYYFSLGYSYRLIVCFLFFVHGILLSLWQLKRILSYFGLRRRTRRTRTWFATSHSGGSRISQRRVLLKKARIARARKFQSHAHLRVGHAYFNKRRAASDPLHRARSCPRFANRPVFVQYHS